VLNRLVDLMVALDLRFIQDKAEDGSLVYRLDPWVAFLNPTRERILIRITAPSTCSLLMMGNGRVTSRSRGTPSDSWSRTR